MHVWQAFRKTVIFYLVGCVITLIALETFADTYFWIELPEQPLISSLNKLSEIGDFNWGATFDANLFKDQIGRPIKGYLTTRQAVEELFKELTTIQYQWVDGGLEISEAKKSAKPRVSIARPMIEEISVIGSHVRGAKSASPVVKVDREQIKNSGFSSTQELVNSLPQVFGGGAAEGAVAAIKGVGAELNIANANGVNLFGIGNGSTLVLLNGHRIAPVGFGNVVDISSIPLNAIEHIEIMADGASAIYGSDAVSGVVNITLRKDYEGHETLVSYGDVTSGSNESYQIGHTFGHRWERGGILINYNYYNRNNLSTLDRPFTRTEHGAGDILGEKIQHDAVLALSQQTTDHLDIYIDFSFSSRETGFNGPVSGEHSYSFQAIKQFNLASGFGFELDDIWRVETGVFYSNSSTESDVTGVFGGSDSTALSTGGLETKLDGSLFEILGGEVKLALGGQVRQDSFKFQTESENLFNKDNSSRHITALFTELFVPLIGEQNSSPGFKRLEFSFAGRHEDYSDFGGSTKPKFGVLWSPAIGVDVRATYSRSFRAPQLYELSEAVNPLQVVAINLLDSQLPEGGSTPTLLVSGYNPALQPEQASSWTIGTDITPIVWPDFRFSFTYFAIDITDRIQAAFTSSDLNNALRNPLYTHRVIRDPEIDLINYWASQPLFHNFTDVSDLSEIGVFIDNRLHNVATVRGDGLNFSVDYETTTNVGDFSLKLDGTYLLSLESKIDNTTSAKDMLNRPYNPVKLKLHSSVSWGRNNFLTMAVVNYIGSYEDKRPEYRGDISAWLTTDFSFRYDIRGGRNDWLQDTTFLLSINNIFDKEPPFVANELGYNYDATNANAVGRNFLIKFFKKW